jgi:hypothetical protein
MANYSNGKIYKIIGGDECYIGSTTKERLCQRMTAQRGNYNNWKIHQKKIYKILLSF